MKTQTAIRSIKDTASNIVDTERESLGKRILPRGRYVVSKRAVSWVGIGLLALFASKYGRTLMSQIVAAKAKAQRHRRDDHKLDQSLQDAMEASDAVAKY